MRARRTRYGPARLRRRASGVGLERHGRHAVSRAGRMGIQRGNRKRKQCARARRARYGPARLSHLASGVALRRDGRDAVSRAGRTGIQRGIGNGRNAREHARRTRYGAAMPSRRASRAALTRHGRDAVSRRERQGGKPKRRRSNSLRQQRCVKAAPCIARHSNRRRQPHRSPAEQHRHLQTAQIPTFGAFRINRNPSNAIAPAATRSTHFFARR